MPWGAAIGGALAAVGSVASASIGSSASSSAANTQAQAANQAAQVQQNMFNTTQGNLQPYMAAGTNALQTLQYGLGLTSAPPSNAGAPPAPPAPAQAGQTPAQTMAGAQALVSAFGGGAPPSMQGSFPDAASAVQAGWSQNPDGTWFDPQGLAFNGSPVFSSVGAFAQPMAAPPAAPVTPPPISNNLTPGALTAQFNGGQPFSFGAGQAGLTGPQQGTVGAPGPGGIAPYQAPAPFSYQPFSFTQSDFQQSPGYQFQLQQGLDAATNKASMTGGVMGGNLLKALDQYGTGLANQDWYNALGQARQNYGLNYNTALGQYTTNANEGANTYGLNFGNSFNAFNTGFNQNQSRQNQVFNMLNALTGSGQNAAANLGGIGTQVANNTGNFLTQAGNANAAGIVGSANALGNGLSSAANSIGGALMSNGGNNLLNPNSFSSAAFNSPFNTSQAWLGTSLGSFPDLSQQQFQMPQQTVF